MLGQHKEWTVYLAVLQLHEHVVIGLQRVCESICLWSTTLRRQDTYTS